MTEKNIVIAKCFDIGNILQALCICKWYTALYRFMHSYKMF